ncbi:MAG TPA: hypothetical protein DD811_02550 [Syntrophomonas sp.]|jgi:hypothetical protein|nr:hypothetical protein [Syntrophomonas sp.]
MKKYEKMTEYEVKSIVLGRVDDLNLCIVCNKTNEYLHVRARLAEALTFAIQLGLLEPIKAIEIGNKADEHICRVYGVSNINRLHWTDNPIKS